MEGKRRVGRSFTRWHDEIKSNNGTAWGRNAGVRTQWEDIGGGLCLAMGALTIVDKLVFVSFQFYKGCFMFIRNSVKISIRIVSEFLQNPKIPIFFTLIFSYMGHSSNKTLKIPFFLRFVKSFSI